VYSALFRSYCIVFVALSLGSMSNKLVIAVSEEEDDMPVPHVQYNLANPPHPHRVSLGESYTKFLLPDWGIKSTPA
jgi:hypothetical protein